MLLRKVKNQIRTNNPRLRSKKRKTFHHRTFSLNLSLKQRKKRKMMSWKYRRSQLQIYNPYNPNNLNNLMNLNKYNNLHKLKSLYKKMLSTKTKNCIVALMKMQLIYFCSKLTMILTSKKMKELASNGRPNTLYLSTKPPAI